MLYVICYISKFRMVAYGSLAPQCGALNDYSDARRAIRGPQSRPHMRYTHHAR